MGDRTDKFGRAFAGSQRQIQTYVNLRPEELNQAVSMALPDLACFGEIEWVSPLEAERYAEYRDEAFIGRIGYPEIASKLAEFWPSAGPSSDALAIVRPFDRGRHGVLLIEAKSYPGEMLNKRGSAAREPARSQILTSVGIAKDWYGADQNANWMGAYYQYANRLAHLYFLRRIMRIPTWFLHVCFVEDPYRPTNERKWNVALDTAKDVLGLKHLPAHVAHIFLKGVGTEFSNHIPIKPPVATQLFDVPDPRYSWRFHRDAKEFWVLHGRNGSSTMRIFDAHSGCRKGQLRSAIGQGYRSAFVDQLRTSIPVTGPSKVDLLQIPEGRLRQMQAEAGMDVIAQGTQPPLFTGSILDQVDSFVDEQLGIEDIGELPHYKHLESYRRIATYCIFDGKSLVAGMYKRLERNWPGNSCRSKENWRWEPKLAIAENNQSLEKTFEKAIVREANGDWVNVVPVASGVMPDSNESGRAIDLVHYIVDGEYEFLELKLAKNCQTPLRAAIQLIEYGLIYLFSRKHQNRLGYDPSNLLLNAKHVQLKVVAPACTYSPGSLQKFEQALQEGLSSLVIDESIPLTLDFHFEMFPPEFLWPSDSVPALELMATRVPVYKK